MGVLDGSITPQLPEQCGEEVQINCDEEVGSNSASESYSVVFPVGSGATLPIAGGAVVTIDFSSLPTTVDDQAIALLTKLADELSSSSFDSNIEGLTQARILVNSIIFDVGKHASLDDFPEVFISTFIGDDSSLKSNTANAAVNKICQLKFIPVEVLEAIGLHFFNLENSDAFGTSDAPIFGASGLKFGDFADLSSDDLAISAAIDLLPFYNISENEIVKKRGKPSVGGYYTIVDDTAYLKVPDLTGRDSAGFDSDLYSEDEERSLYFEILNGATLTRITVSDISTPPAATVAGYDAVFPVTGTIEIELDTESDISSAYLSLIVAKSKPSVRGVKVFNNGIELTTIPMLTKPVSSKLNSNSPFGVFNYESIEDFDAATLSNHLTENEAILAIDGFDGKYGKISLDSETDLASIYGEQNRPEILLANRTKDKSNRRNNRKYGNPKMTMARELFAQTRPRFYEDVPESWVKGTPSSDGTIITFTAGDMAKIKQSADAGSTDFALYVGNGTQIARVPGSNIVLGAPSPSIESISPNGFAGSSIITAEDSIRIGGEDLNGVFELIFTSGSGNVVSVNSVDYEDFEISASSSIIQFKLGPDAYSDLSAEFEATYDLQVLNVSGGKSNKLPIYIGTPALAPPHPDLIIEFESDTEFSSASFSENPDGIPLLSDGLNAEIKIRSKSKLFSGNYPLFAYLALGKDDEEIMKEFEFDIRTFGDLIVAAGVEFEFSESPVEDFYKLTKRKAAIRFPGKGYKGYNFSRLTEVKEAHILFTNSTIKDIAGSATELTLDSTQHNILTLGGNTSTDPDKSSPPTFINPASITQVIAEVPGGKVISMAEIGASDTDLIDIFGKKPDPGNISVFKTIPKLAVVFAGSDMPFMRKRHDFFLGDKSIKSKLHAPIEVRENGKEVTAVFRNVNSNDEGFLDFKVERNDKRYNVTYDSGIAYGTVTGEVTSDSFDIDSKTQELTLSTEIPGETSSIVNETSGAEVLNSLFKVAGSGAIVVDPSDTANYTLYNPASIISKQGDFNLTLRTVGSSSFSNTKIIANSTESDVIEISRLDLSLPSGSIYASGEYITDVAKGGDIASATKALVFGRAGIVNPVSLGFNIPRIVGIATSMAGLEPPTLPDQIAANAGDTIFFRVENVKKNFSIKLGSSVVKAVAPVKVASKTATYDVQATIPSTLSGFIPTDDCLVLCASGTNSDRLKAKKILGSSFVIDIEEKMKERLFGKFNGKIPDVQDLKDILARFPLKFLSVELDTSMVPLELINSFCDLSWHLMADLKLALNGFQVLMIPIQVIFCIIDVLCALLNPIKTAKAMIRLFECVFDLVLLIPQISVPVMYLKLILHLLNLLECIINKILGIILAINAIVPAMKAALENKDWASLKALEEVLSEYLFDLNVDLDILAPVIAILAIFLQLLQLVFRFPCQVTPGEAEAACGLDGTLLAGIISGKAVDDGNAFTAGAMIPVGQAYTKDSIETAAASGGSTITQPVSGQIVAQFISAENSDDEESPGGYIESMKLNEDTLRATNDVDLGFLAQFGISFTKSRKAFKTPNAVEFLFSEKYDPITFFIPSKIIDPDQSADSPLSLMDEDGSGNIEIASGKGNFVSPIDGSTFITKDGDFGTVKPLELRLEVPIYEVNDETGDVEVVGMESKLRTFDEIPKMVILDEEFNVYFIEKGGIEFDSDDKVSKIRALMINNISAPKLKFSKESQPLDIDPDDGDINEDDVEIRVYDFPQLYFLDMRECHEEIQQACYNASMNSFLLEEDNTEEIIDIVEETQDCLEEFQNTVRGFADTMRASLNAGEIPDLIDSSLFDTAVATMEECLNDGVDKMCRFALNTLNTSFKVAEDDDDTPLDEFVVVEVDSDELEELGFEEDPRDITGSNEYAEGDGDSAILGLGEKATIIVTPRDSSDLPLGGDFTERIILEIVSDDTGDAEIIENENGTFFEQDGDDYIAFVTANSVGEVRLRAKVCDRTIQAVTFAGLEGTDGSSDSEVDCIEDVGTEETESSPSLGALTKVDRIISVFFIKKSTVKLGSGDDPGTVAHTDPQAFGTKLEN